MTVPRMPPCLPKIGDALSSMPSSSPLRANNTLRPARPVMRPCTMQRRTGSTAGSRVSSSKMRNNSASGRPITSGTDPPDGVGGDHGIAEGAQGHHLAIFLFQHRLLRALALDDLALQLRGAVPDPVFALGVGH